MTHEDLGEEFTKCVAITSPGIHVVLFVTDTGRFTEEEEKTIKLLYDKFGQDIIHFLIIVFTGMDGIKREGSSIKAYVKSIEPSSMLSEIIEKCRRRYIAFDNTAEREQNDEQVIRLFSEIENLVLENGRTFFTNNMFKEAEKILRRKAKEKRNRWAEEQRQKLLASISTLKPEVENEKQRGSLSDAFRKDISSIKQSVSSLEEALQAEKTYKERIQADKNNLKKTQIMIETETNKLEEIVEKVENEMKRKGRQVDGVSRHVLDLLSSLKSESKKLLQLYKDRESETSYWITRDKMRDGFANGTFKFAANLFRRGVDYAIPIMIAAAVGYVQQFAI